MSRPTPGSHVVISAALLSALIPLSFLSLWHTRSGEVALEDALHQDLLVLRQLPELRSSIRRLDLLTELYLSNPRKDVLVRRDGAADAIRSRRDELRSLCSPDALTGACGEFESRLGAFLSADDLALLNRELAKTRVARRTDLLDALTSLSNAAAAELMRRLDAAQSALLDAALLRVLLESAAALALVSCFYVFVRDTGIGFTVQERELILRGHYRTERGRKMASKGFGLGLALTRQIVEAHGCTLDVHSRPDLGSEFSFAMRLEAGDPAAEMSREKA